MQRPLPGIAGFVARFWSRSGLSVWLSGLTGCVQAVQLCLAQPPGEVKVCTGKGLPEARDGPLLDIRD